MRDTSVADDINKGAGIGIEDVDISSVADEQGNVAKMIIDRILPLLSVSKLVYWSDRVPSGTEVFVEDASYSREWFQSHFCADGISHHRLIQHGRNHRVWCYYQVIIALWQFKRSNERIQLPNTAAAQVVHVRSFQRT